jgi:hypothetical protein
MRALQALALLDRDPFHLLGRLLRQFQRQHAVGVLRLGLAVVDVLRQAEGARDVAPVAFAAQQLAAFALGVILSA